MHDEIEKLKSVFNNTKSDESKLELKPKPDFEYAVSRFCKSYHSKGQLVPDDIVLLRQCLRWSGLSDIRIDRPVLDFDKLEILLKKSDMYWSQSGYLSARPYAPKWLEKNVRAIDELPRRRFIDESYLGEQYLNRLGYKKWRSQAQKEGAWLAITSAPGSTNTIVLPTGYGKSLCFQLLPVFSTGLTVVVVPTVALAIEQYHSATKIFKNYTGVNPCFFSSNNASEETLYKLKNKESRLVFASPETCVSGKLRPILNNLSSEGWFDNLVVDEAHLIETWGALFRVEFQILAACRQDWLKKSGNNLRTFLLSATMSPGCRETLNDMFSDSSQKEGLICQRLRPEIKYYGRWFNSKEERWPYLCEAIWRLPRPLILYVTTREEADDVYQDIKNERFERVGCFTGRTSGSERERLISEWRDNKIDLMVATSAFGVGVDKSDVRSVIHACYPENLDRYYQEVGRSGRDGYSSICLLLPTKKDKQIARKLGSKILKDKKKIQERWESMYSKCISIPEDEYVCKLPLSVKRKGLIGHPTFSQNVRWNKALLLQLFRAKQIDFLSLEYRPIEDTNDNMEELATIKVNFPPETRRLPDLMKNENQNECSHFEKTFEQVSHCIDGKYCISLVLKKLYEVASDQRVCGGCFSCRKKGADTLPCPPLKIPPNDLNQDELQYNGNIIEGCPDPTQKSQIEDFIDLIESCSNKHSLKPIQIYCPEEYFEFIFLAIEKVLRQYNQPYRVEPFKNETEIISTIGSPIFLHIGSFSKSMLEKGIQFVANHLFCGIPNVLDPNGRHIRINYGCNKWSSPEAWLGEIN